MTINRNLCKVTLYITLVSLVLVSCLLNFQETEARESRCPPARDQEFETCSERMGFLGNHAFRVPKNATSADKFCNELKNSLTCVQNYSKECISGFPRQLLGALLKRGKQQYSTICHDNQSKREFMRRMSCLSDDKIEGFHTLMDASVARFEHINTKVKLDASLVSLCCSYQIFDRDLDAKLSQICEKPSRTSGRPQASQGNINEYMRKIASGTAGEFLNLICENHRSYEDCQKSKKTAPVLPELEVITKSVYAGKLAPVRRSILPVLLEILEKS